MYERAAEICLHGRQFHTRLKQCQDATILFLIWTDKQECDFLLGAHCRDIKSPTLHISLMYHNAYFT